VIEREGDDDATNKEERDWREVCLSVCPSAGTPTVTVRPTMVFSPPLKLWGLCLTYSAELLYELLRKVETQVQV
jgi:hypothetical protein